jgi:hypothetical protein
MGRRDSYSPSELLGGADATFFVGQMEATRIDYELQNKHGLTLKCSHYLPLDAKSADGKLPVVVYCHCNSGSRRDAEEAVFHLLPCGVGVVSFDFTVRVMSWWRREEAAWAGGGTAARRRGMRVHAHHAWVV